MLRLVARKRRGSEIRLAERVLLDAIAQRVGPERAPDVLQRSLEGTPLPPPSDSDPDEITEFIQDHLSLSLARVIGAEDTKEVLDTAEALVAPLRRDVLVQEARVFRAPYILVSERPHPLEGAIELRRVETMIEAACEADVMPEATLVVDVRTSSLSLVTLALAAIDLPAATQILVVGANDKERASYEAIARRAATFVEHHLPLDLRAPVRLGRSARAA